GAASVIVNFRTRLVWFVHAPAASTVPSVLSWVSADGGSGGRSAAVPTPRTERGGLSPPVNVTSPRKVSADVGLKRTVTVCVCPAASEYAPPEAMLNGGAVLTAPASVPVPTFWTAKVRSADAPTATEPKSREAGVTAIAGCGAWPTVHKSEVPS